MSQICQEVKCKVCGELFRQNRWWQKVCSETCRVTYRRASLAERMDGLGKDVDWMERALMAERALEEMEYELRKVKKELKAYQSGYQAQWED